jgi:hypothetical protein
VITVRVAHAMVASARVGHAGKAPGLRRLVGPTTVRATATIVATATGAAPIAIVRTEEEAIAGGPTPVAPATGAGTPEAVIGIADMQNDATTAIDADMATDHARMTGIDRGSRTVRTAVDATRAGATVAVSTIGSLVRTARAQAAPARAAPAANETGTETARTAAATPAVAASVNAIAISTGTGTATGTATGIGTGTATPTGPRPARIPGPVEDGRAGTGGGRAPLSAAAAARVGRPVSSGRPRPAQPRPRGPGAAAVLGPRRRRAGVATVGRGGRVD